MEEESTCIGEEAIVPGQRSVHLSNAVDLQIQLLDRVFVAEAFRQDFEAVDLLEPFVQV